MKEATGELNMTVIVVIIIAALAGIGTLIIVPAVSTGVRSSSCRSILNDEGARALKDGAGDYYCCPTGTSVVGPTCQIMEE